jgi:hypothetical protein
MAFQVRKQTSETAKPVAFQILITGEAVRFSAIPPMNAIEDRALGRQARQAHPRESNAAPIQLVAGRKHGMKERFFEIKNDLDCCGHSPYTQNTAFFPGTRYGAAGPERFADVISRTFSNSSAPAKHLKGFRVEALTPPYRNPKTQENAPRLRELREERQSRHTGSGGINILYHTRAVVEPF